MKALTDEEWDRLFDLLRGIREGKTIQWFDSGVSDDADTWLDDGWPCEMKLFANPLRYRVKPETVTLYAYRLPAGYLHISNQEFTTPGERELIYTFEHEVQA